MTAWHIAVCQPNAEWRVISELRRLGFQAICPHYTRYDPIGSRQPRGKPFHRLGVAYPRYIALAGACWQNARAVEKISYVLPQPGDDEQAYTLPDAILPLILGRDGDGLLHELCEVPADAPRRVKARWRKLSETQPVDFLKHINYNQ